MWHGEKGEKRITLTAAECARSLPGGKMPFKAAASQRGAKHTRVHIQKMPSLGSTGGVQRLPMFLFQRALEGLEVVLGAQRG